jgi:hypothetical protein
MGGFHGRIPARWATALAVSLIMCFGTPAAATETAPTTRIMLYGDSLTHGSSGDWTWRYRLWQTLVTQSVKFDFVGPRSDVVTYSTRALGSLAYRQPYFDRNHAALWGTRFLTGYYQLANLTPAYQPDVIVSLIGLNDVYSGATLGQLSDHWRSQIAAARAAKPGVDIVLVPLPHTWYAGVAAYNDSLRGIAAELDDPNQRVIVTSAPQFAMWTDTYDFAHPTATGERKIAGAVAEGLARLGIGNGNLYTKDNPAPGPWAPTPTATPVDNAVKLSWPAVTYASSENIQVYDAVTGRRQDVKYVTGTSATVSGAASGKYLVRLAPVKGYIQLGTYSAFAYAAIPVATPTPEPTPTPTVTSSPTPEPSPTPSATETPTPGPTSTPTNSASPTPDPTPSG